MGFVVHTCTTTPRLVSVSVRMIGSIMKESRLVTRRQKGTLFGRTICHTIQRNMHHLLFSFYFFPSFFFSLRLFIPGWFGIIFHKCPRIHLHDQHISVISTSNAGNIMSLIIGQDQVLATVEKPNAPVKCELQLLLQRQPRTSITTREK